MTVPEHARISRRTTREVGSRTLLEDLWVGGGARERLLRRSLRRPRDVEVDAELAEMGEDDKQLSWEETLMCASQATHYRAVMARLNCLSTGRTDIQFACKEARMRMSSQLTPTGRFSNELDATYSDCHVWSTTTICTNCMKDLPYTWAAIGRDV